MTGNSHSVDDDQNAQSMDMSICKSENLFSPMNENQEALPLSTFSTDSLDTRAGEILATCMTNRNNYTIAFQGMEESNTSSTYKTAPADTNSSSEIIENDPGMMTNWRQVTSNNSTGSQQRSIDNNNGSNESSTGGTGTPNNNSSNRTSWSNTTGGTLSKHSLMTQSCPHPPRNNNMTMITNNLGIFRTNPAAAIKLFDIQNVQTVQLAQIYQRHVVNRQRQQLGSGSSMTDSGSMNNNNSNNNNNPMMTSGTGSSLSSGRHNTPQILEESWNNNRNPTAMMPTTTPTHHHPTHPHHHHYSKYRSRKHSSTSTSSSSPTTTQLADAVRKLRSIEIQTSITLVTPPPSSKLYSNNETNEVGSNASAQRNNSQGSYHHHQQQHPSSHNAQSHHLSQQQQKSNQPPPVYICYPSYTLPDLRFLDQHRPKNPVILMPQRYKTSSGRMAGVHRTQTSMACPGTGGYGGGAPLHNVPKGRRPFSCNDIEELRCRDLSHVKDWPSLNFLLPKEYQAILAELKPPEKREQRDDSEKETADIKEESCSQNYPNVRSSSSTRQSSMDNNGAEYRDSAGDSGLGSGGGAAVAAAAAAAAGESPVILRRRLNGGNGRQNPTKRYSMNDAAGFLGQQVGIASNRNRNGLAEKFKRFSLQETLPEVAEITSEIAKNLEQLESLALTATSTNTATNNGQSINSLCGGENRNHHQQQHNQHQFEDIDESQNSTDNIPSFTGISSSEEESTSGDISNHHHKRVPTNTPKQTSFVDFDNHFQLRSHGFFDDGGAAAAARIIAHVAPLCPNSGNKGAAHSQKAPIDMALKQSLTDAVAAAVNQIQSVWETTQAMKNVATSGASGSGCGPSPSSADNKSRLTPTSDTAAMTPTITGLAACLASPHKSLYQSIMSQTPAGKTVLETLCPALYSLLSDGLCPFLDTIFGRVPNTVWRVVEASIQYGPTAQSLNELVLRINSEELLAEGPMKFNAFVCGLLNLRNLGSWLTFLRTKERLLRTHYEPDAFMFLCNTTTRFLYDQMLVNMHLLSKTPFPAFQLDIFHETKLLHQSMNPVTPTKSLPASLPVSRKNSVKGSSRYNANGAGSTGGTPRKSTSADARPVKTQSKNSKYHANQLKKSQMKRSFSDERPKTTRVAPSTIPKSKTAQNITHDRNQHHHHPASGLPGPTSTFNTRLLSRFPSRPKLSNYRGDHAGGSGSHDDDGREKGMSEPTKAQRPKSFDGSHLTNVASGGGVVTHLPKGLSPDSNKDTERFRRLQMQWELLSSDESRKGSSPGQSHTSSNTSNTTGPSLAGSKIPRPINSPTRANIVAHLGNVRPSTASKR
ncbi:unnamed protein product [Orchesella dallaii]|uniref:RUN domain-containing protein n=1 Tax=Orchesella dallaii TaxID=48710 RepID=A0ABP1S3S6_9HEXA